MKRQTLRKIIARISFLICLIQVASTNLFATHSAGMEMFYRWVQDSTYEFTLIFYRNCQGFAASPPTTFAINSKANSIGKNYNAVLNRLPSSGPGVPLLEPPGMYNCTEDFNSLCIEEYVYRGNWTSQGRAPDWIISAEICCRPGPPPYANSIANINYDSEHIECGLNNKDFPDTKSKNWSPLWHNRRPNHPGYLTDTIINYFFKTVCVGNYYSIDQSAREYQGDSVSYGFFWPQGTNGNKVTYSSGWSFANPLPTLNGKLTINPITGFISLVPGMPTATGIYTLGIEAKEWRHDTSFIGGSVQIVPKLIGYNRRELMIWIDDSNNCRKDSAHLADIYLDTVNVDKKLTVYFNNGIAGSPNSLLRCETLSSDGSEFRIVDSSTYVAPNPSTLSYIGVVGATWNCQAGLTGKVTLQLTEALKCGDYHIILRKGTDLDVLQSECGYWEAEYSSAKIHRDTMPKLDLGSDKEVCKELPVNVKLVAPQGYASYYWDTWDSTRIITVHYARTYWARATDNFGCESSDTISIIAKKCNSTGKVTPVPGGGLSGIDRYNSVEEMEEDAVKVYPNPTTGRLFISLPEITGQEQVILSDLSGKKTGHYSISYTGNGIEVDLNEMNRGFYILQVMRNGDVLLTEKVRLTGTQ